MVRGVKPDGGIMVIQKFKRTSAFTLLAMISTLAVFAGGCSSKDKTPDYNKYSPAYWDIIGFDTTSLALTFEAESLSATTSYDWFSSNSIYRETKVDKTAGAPCTADTVETRDCNLYNSVTGRCDGWSNTIKSKQTNAVRKWRLEGRFFASQNPNKIPAGNPTSPAPVIRENVPFFFTSNREAADKNRFWLDWNQFQFTIGMLAQLPPYNQPPQKFPNQVTITDGRKVRFDFGAIARSLAYTVNIKSQGIPNMRAGGDLNGTPTLVVNCNTDSGGGNGVARPDTTGQFSQVFGSLLKP